MRTTTTAVVAVGTLVGIGVGAALLLRKKPTPEDEPPPPPPSTFPPAPVEDVPPSVYVPQGEWIDDQPIYDMPPIANVDDAWPAFADMARAVIALVPSFPPFLGEGEDEDETDEVVTLGAAYNHGPYPYAWLYGESADSQTTPGAFKMVDMYYGTAWNSPLLELKFALPPEHVALPLNRLFVPPGFELLQLAPNGEMGPAYHAVIDAFVLQDKDVWRYQTVDPTPVCSAGGYTRAEAEALGYKASDFVTHETWIRTWCVERGFMVCAWQTQYCSPKTPDWQLFLISPQYFRNLRGFPGIYIVALPYGLASTKENWDRWAQFWA